MFWDARGFSPWFANDFPFAVYKLSVAKYEIRVGLPKRFFENLQFLWEPDIVLIGKGYHVAIAE